jgi:phage gpG-like protein
MADSVKIEIDDTALRATFDQATPRVHNALLREVQLLRLELESKIKGDKLSGQVLHVVSGDLRRSIYSGVIDRADFIQGFAAQSGDVKYGAIHEFGGIIHVPEIVPAKAKALHWVFEGKDVFAKRARAHDVTMPERSYMRSTLKEMEPEIAAGLKAAVLRALGA